MCAKINLNILKDFDVVPADEKFHLRVMMTADGSATQEKEESRQPLNIALVLDRSGSMGGSKLSHVKMAVLEIVKLLNADDIISLTVFDDQVDVLMRPTRIDQLEGFIRIVENIRTGGSTNLHGGYERGCELLRKGAEGGMHSRLILLTDGLANVGLTDPSALASFSGQMQEQGIVTTTIGVGDGYNEFLLGKMAENGGGGAYFIEKPDDAVAVFSEEIGSLKNLVATGFEVKIKNIINGCQFTQLNSYRELSQYHLNLGAVYAGQQRRLVYEVEIPPCELNEEIQIATMEVICQLSHHGKAKTLKQDLPITLSVVEKKAFAKVSPNREVTLEAAFLIIARANRGAIELADKHNYEKAAELLFSVAGQLREMKLGDPKLERELNDLEERAKRLREERDDYYNARERKRMFHEYDMSTKSFRDSMFAMKERRVFDEDLKSQSDPGRSFRYRCYLVGGHVLAEVGNERVLLDTGGMFSIGGSDSIRFANRRFPLHKEFMGANIGSVCNLIGTEVSALVGVDILSQLNFMIDLDDHFLTSTSSQTNGSQTVLDFKTFQNIPIIEVQVGGRKLPMLLDTGAKLSYITREIFEQYPVCGRERDFLITADEFETDVVSVPVRVAGDELIMSFGSLPKVVQAAVDMTGAKGVLGSELLHTFRMRYLGPRRKIELRPLPE